MNQLVKAVILTTGDHHTGLRYDYCVLIPFGQDINAWRDEFVAAFPFRCAAHDYGSAVDAGCEQCQAAGDAAETALTEFGINLPEKGFWNGSFADWLVKTKGAVALDLDECAVCYG
jgi:hypothetical protein